MSLQENQINTVGFCKRNNYLVVSIWDSFEIFSVLNKNGIYYSSLGQNSIV